MIRPARASDLAELPAVEASAATAFLAAPGLAWLAESEAISDARHVELLERGITLVAEEHDAIVGFICSEPLGDNLHIRELSVRHGYQRKGIGLNLIEDLAERAAAAGWPALTLTTFRDLAWNAPFYQRIGFEEIPGTEQSTDMQAGLRREADNGLPPERRCAMILSLA